MKHFFVLLSVLFLFSCKSSNNQTASETMGGEVGNGGQPIVNGDSGDKGRRDIYCLNNPEASALLQKISDQLKEVPISLLRCADWEILFSKDAGSLVGGIIGIKWDKNTNSRISNFVEMVKSTHALAKKRQVGLSLRNSMLVPMFAKKEYATSIFNKFDEILKFFKLAHVNNFTVGDAEGISHESHGNFQSSNYLESVSLRTPSKLDDEINSVYFTAKIVNDAQRK